jgi:NADH-quinone oxidoreductase subunit M
MILLSIILLPLLSAVMLAVLGGGRALARWVALLTAIGTLLLSLGIATQLRPFGDSRAASAFANTANGPIQPRLEWRKTWLTFGEMTFERMVAATPAETASGKDSDPDRVVEPPVLVPIKVTEPVRMEFYLGADGVSVLMLMLTAVLTISAILISWESITERAVEFYICLLVLEAGMLGAFIAFDVLLFYVFFEFTLIPLFLLVGIWGGSQRQAAAYRFFIYTLAGSVITLLGLVVLVLKVLQEGLTATPFSIPDIAAALKDHPLPDPWQIGLLLALSAGFVIKVPLFPFHTWLPLAHTEAPTAGSVLLAGILLKLGTYGFLRLCLPLLPDAVAGFGVPVFASMAVIGIVYGALGALAQSDIKKLVAYSSVSHLGFCMLGMFALNAEGVSGSVLQMVNHGLSTGALFLLVGMVYDRYHTRELSELGGLANRLPWLSVCMVFICLASAGLPGLNGFVGELLSLIGMFKAHAWYSVIGATGLVLGAWYLLDMLRRGFFGPLQEPSSVHGHIADINVRECLAVVPLMGLCLWIGVYPAPALELIENDVRGVVQLYPHSSRRPVTKASEVTSSMTGVSRMDSSVTSVTSKSDARQPSTIRVD